MLKRFHINIKRPDLTGWLSRHREYLMVMLMGLVIIVGLNVMMLAYHYDAWTNPKVGFWTAFSNRFEISGFDCFTYIILSKWRPLYVLSRHPLLAVMVWPLAQLNSWLTGVTGINCTIFIVAVVWGLLSLCSWMLFYHLMRRGIGLRGCESVLLTFFFFSFSHVMLTIITPDHMTWTLPLVLLTLVLAMRAMRRGGCIPLWQSLLLCFVSTGITTTNCVKIYLADIVSYWPGKSIGMAFRRSLAYFIPLALIAGAFVWQQNTTQKEEERYAESIIEKRSRRDSAFAEMIQKSLAETEAIHSNQIINLPSLTNTEYHIDRLPSVTENVFGEGFILHETYTLKDANRHRPVLVRYEYWINYVLEVLLVLLFLAGLWHGRHERLVWMTGLMFAFDMLIHVGLNFASADVYIMTSHWAFIIPIAVGYMLRYGRPELRSLTTALVLCLTIYMWLHNGWLTADHLLRLNR